MVKKKITMDYDNHKITIEQVNKDGVVLDVYDNGEYIGCICGTDIISHCRRLTR